MLAKHKFIHAKTSKIIPLNSPHRKHTPDKGVIVHLSCFLWHESEDLSSRSCQTAQDFFQLEQIRSKREAAVDVTRVFQEKKKVCLQGRGVTHFTQLILSLCIWFTHFVLAFEVHLVEFTGDGGQRLALGLRQKQADVQSRQQTDSSKGHKAVLTQLAL